MKSFWRYVRLFPSVLLQLKKMHNETQEDKWNRGLTLFTESVLKPDPELRNCAHNQKCYHELMYIREHVLEYLKTLRK
jgi:hypothetical protein